MRREKGLCGNVCATAIEERKKRNLIKGQHQRCYVINLMRHYLAFNIENKKKKARLII